MSNPVTPNSFKNLIPSLTASVCDKLSKVFQLPAEFYAWYSWKHTETGTFSSDYKAILCAVLAECADIGDDDGENPTNPSMPSPTGVSATDGTYSDKVVITWNTVTPPDGIAAVTEYRVYRSLSTNTNPNDASLLATVTAPTTTYEDASAIQGTSYNYWVVATNGSQTSAYGGPDVGHADAPATTMDPITDLIASRGLYYLGSSGHIHLQWTKPTGATHYDIYRGTTSTFASATKIETDIVPEDTTELQLTGECFENLDGVIVYFDKNVPSHTVIYYYWVVAKKNAPPATSAESNVASGYVNIATEIGTVEAIGKFTSSSGAQVIPAGCTTAKLTFIGRAGCGAGGGPTYGGGGGGGAGLAFITVAVNPADTLELILGAGTGTGTAAAETSGEDGRDLELRHNGVAICTITGGLGGQYSSSGGGTGGTGGQVSGTASMIAINGQDGEDGSGGVGGRGGMGNMGFCNAPAHYPPNGHLGYSGDADESWNSSGGGGSWANVLYPTQMTGGAASTLVQGCIYCFGA